MDSTPESTLVPEALRITNEMIWAVTTYPGIHVNRFTVGRPAQEYFEYFLGHHQANTPTPFRQYQRLDHNMIPQLQFLGLVEVATGAHIPEGWYRFTEKAVEWYRSSQELQDRIPAWRPISSTVSVDNGYDVFISHAWEDKEDLVRPLASSLVETGLKVWYDEFTLSVGDSLRQSIDRGLRDSRYGIVVLSHDFFAKNWPQYELNGLVSKSISGRGEGTVLPIWHNVTSDEVRNYSWPLSDIVALSTANLSIDQIAEKIATVVSPR